MIVTGIFGSVHNKNHVTQLEAIGDGAYMQGVALVTFGKEP